MGDFLPCALPYSGLLHACDTFAGPALCRPEGPAPLWYSPIRWHPRLTDACPRCIALATAAHELARIDELVAQWGAS